MKNKLTKEEAIFREKLEEVSFEYQDADWSEIEESLINKNPNSGYKSLLKGVAGLILVSAVVVLTNQYYQSEEATENAKTALIEKEESKTKITGGTAKSPSHEKTVAEIETVENETPAPIENSDVTVYDDSVSTTELAIDEVVDSINLQTVNHNDIEETVVNQKIENTELQELELVVIGKPCINNELKITVPNTNKSNYDKFLWIINGKKLNETDNNLIYTIKKIGELEIKVEAYKNNLLLAENTLNYTIEDNPELDYRYEDLEDPFHDLKVTLKAEGNLPGTFQWDINGERIKMSGETSYEFNNRGIYDIRLIYLSKNGCQSEITKPVAVRKDFDPFAPTAFTPDGDGINDLFIIESFAERTDQFEMSIYDQKGNIVFHTNSFSEGWNGRKNNKGPVLPRNTYVWKVIIQNKDKIEKSFAGRVKLLDF